LPILRLFVSEGIDGIVFIDMRLNDEFYFALAERIHTILISPRTSNQPQTLQRLNELHPDLNLDPFLARRLPFGRSRVG
jgi:hypothetical protein